MFDGVKTQAIDRVIGAISAVRIDGQTRKISERLHLRRIASPRYRGMMPKELLLLRR